VGFTDADRDNLIDALLASLPSDLPEREHAVRSAWFGLQLFRAFADVLGLSAEHARIVVAAALLHDIGYLRGEKDHHRKSYDIIRSLALPGFSGRERLIVACAARYHGRSLPNIEHAGFGDMQPADQRVVRRVAALVRVATALDASHLGLIDDIDAFDRDGRLTVIARSRVEPAVERDRLRESAGGFQSLTQLSLQTEVQVVPQAQAAPS
jgi:exopolyphosphatase/pppGpp-phosphohydrolase